jgi:hypothetical protein
MCLNDNLYSTYYAIIKIQCLLIPKHVIIFQHENIGDNKNETKIYSTYLFDHFFSNYWL